MAQKVLVELLDDIDGKPATNGAVEFGLEGVSYEIDLSDDNLQRLREALSEFVAHARRVGGRKRAASKPGRPSGADSDASKIREWAASTGEFELAERGRIPAHVVEAYRNRDKAKAAPAEAEVVEITDKPATKSRRGSRSAAAAKTSGGTSRRKTTTKAKA